MANPLQLYYQPPEIKILALNSEDVVKTSGIKGWAGNEGDFSGKYDGISWEE